MLNEDLDAFFDDGEFAYVMQWTAGGPQESNVLLDEPHESFLDDRAVSAETRVTGITDQLTGITTGTQLTISVRAADGTLTNARSFKAVEPPRRVEDGALSEFRANAV